MTGVGGVWPQALGWGHPKQQHTPLSRNAHLQQNLYSTQQYHSFLKICTCFLVERQTKRNISAGSLPDTLNSWARSRLRTYSMSLRSGWDPTTWAKTCCLPEDPTAGSWNWEWNWDLNPGIPMCDVGDPSSTLITMSNPCPKNLF